MPTIAPLVVGFDLDLTLIDTRPGMRAVFDHVAALRGVPIDSAAAVGRLGPPLDEEFIRWAPAEAVPGLIEDFRAAYPGLAVAASPALPGALDAVAAVHALGGRVLVVTGKFEPNALLHLEHLLLPHDRLVGTRWGTGKTEVLCEENAHVYVGDHVGDMRSARAAEALALGVPLTPEDAGLLEDAGADVILPSLLGFPAWLADFELARRLEYLLSSLRGYGEVLVAFSGGADSALVLAAAVRALGADRVVAATAVSASLPGAELDAAAEFAAGLGVRHLTPRTAEMEREGYRANAGNRCYFCKAELLDTLRPLADELGIDAVATGTNADDAVAGFRPGIAAATERRAVTPLLDAALTKRQVRQVSAGWGLVTADKPAAACLSSRVAYGVPIDGPRLARIEAAESDLRGALAAAGVAVRDLRVRDLGADRARVEVDAALVPRLDASVLAAVSGFRSVEVDPRGFRSGSMNDALRPSGPE